MVSERRLSRNVTELAATLLRGETPGADEVAGWAGVGLTRFDVWTRLAGRWAELVGEEIAAGELVPACLDHALAAPDPDAASVNLSRLQAEIGGVTLPRMIVADPRFGHNLLYLLGLGSLPADSLIREPGLIDLLVESDLLLRERSALVLAGEATGMLLRLKNQEIRRAALRRWKRGQFLRIIIRDHLLHRPQQEVTREISAVADACVRAALAAAASEAGATVDDDGNLRGICVVAMGKWGSRELNYNSDIDLLCVYRPAPGGLDGAAWEQVIQAMTRDLDEQTIHGRVFRVDHRLRPEGGSGTIVRSLESCAAYYQNHGQAWEAQALTRARWAAGDPLLGQHFEDLAKRISFGARVGRAGVANIRRNRERLDARADAERDVKEGRGGIRDIEFTVQLLQLVRGVTDPAVRARNTWDALEALTRAGSLTELERRTLAETYDFLRRVEHLLQIQPVAPTKLLPTDSAAQRRLARALGYRDAGPLSAWDRFGSAYRSHTAAARDLCERLFFNPIPLSSPEAGQAIQELLDPIQTDEEAIRHLADIPFDNPKEARRRLLFLAHGEPPMRLPPEIQAVFVELLPALLACIQRMPDPDAALRWFERFIANAGGRDIFYHFLLDHPPVIEVLCRIGGFSDVLSQTIVDHPEYLDRVIDPRFMSWQPSRDDLATELAERRAPLRSPALRLDDVRRFRRRELFRIGVQDLLGELEVDQVVAELSDLAEVCTAALLDEVRELAGLPDLPFAILGCGKIGGREIHYSSDLDILFAYQSDDPTAAAQAERLARAVLRESGQRTRAGKLPELDARLRPFGPNSPLTRSIAGYRNYFAQRGQPWERLAMSRARHLAGDREVGDAFCAVAHGFAFDGGLEAGELDELRRVKSRIEAERSDTDAEHLDIKLTPGGILEIEFLAQILQIQHGCDGPARANTTDALRHLAERGLLPPGEVDVLVRNYRWFRRLETRLQLVLERSAALLPLDDEGLTTAAKRLGWGWNEAQQRPDRLVADLRHRLDQVHAIYRREIGEGPASP